MQIKTKIQLLAFFYIQPKMHKTFKYTKIPIKGFIFLIGISVIWLCTIKSFQMISDSTKLNNVVLDLEKRPKCCNFSNHNSYNEYQSFVEDRLESNKRNKKIFWFSKQTRSNKDFDYILRILDSNRIEYFVGFSLDELIEEQETISIILFEFYDDYINSINNLNFKLTLINNNIGVFVFNNHPNQAQVIEINECNLNDKFKNSEFFHITKYNTQNFQLNKSFKYNFNFTHLFFSELNSESILKCNAANENQIENLLFTNDIDGIKCMFFSLIDFENVWLLKPLFLDSIRYLSNQEIDFSLKRYVQIDIDDIFVAKTGTRMVPSDVNELIRLQNELTNHYFYHDNYTFKFTLGFCGYYFKSGNKIENEADELLIGFNYLIYWSNLNFNKSFFNFYRKQQRILLV